MTWKELFDDKNIKGINLVGYGSLMNRRTLFGNSQPRLHRVIVNNYMRIYNSTYLKEQCGTYSEKHDVFKKNAIFLKEDYQLEGNKLKWESNSGSLNIEYREGSKLGDYCLL